MAASATNLYAHSALAPDSKLTGQEVKHEGSANGTETYTITGALDKNVQLNVTLTRPADAPGFKFGEGPDGGFSTFGKSREDGKRDGLVVQCVFTLKSSSGASLILQSIPPYRALLRICHP